MSAQKNRVPIIVGCLIFFLEKKVPTIDTVSSTQKNRVDIRIGCLNFAQVVARLFLDPIKSVHLFVLDTVRSAQKNRLTIIIGHWSLTR